ncbi:hypothetical protein D3C73_906980 [compost metagenome]
MQLLGCCQSICSSKRFAVKCSFLMRVFTITEILDFLIGYCEAFRQWITCYFRQIIGDQGIVSRSMTEHFCSKLFTSLQCSVSIRTYLFQNLGIISRINDNTDKRMIFSCRTKHSWSADIDIFDGIFIAYIRFCNRLLEWIQIHDNQINVIKAQFFHLSLMLLTVTNCQQSTMNRRMQRFNATIQNFRETCHIRDTNYWHTLFRQKVLGSPCRNNFHTQLRQLAAKIHDPCFIRHTYQCSFDTQNWLLLYYGES